MHYFSQTCAYVMLNTYLFYFTWWVANAANAASAANGSNAANATSAASAASAANACDGWFGKNVNHFACQ